MEHRKSKKYYHVLIIKDLLWMMGFIPLLIFIKTSKITNEKSSHEKKVLSQIKKSYHEKKLLSQIKTVLTKKRWFSQITKSFHKERVNSHKWLQINLSAHKSE